MSSTRVNKEQVIEELRGLFEEAEALLLTNPIGLDVNTINGFRSKCRAEGIHFRVVKNKLAGLALKGTDKEGLIDLLKGPTAVAFKQGDPVTPAKLVLDFAKDNEKFVIKGGILSGKVLDQAGVESLSKMKTIPELRASFLSVLKAPQTEFVGINNTMVTQILGLLNARKDDLDKGDEAAA